MGIFSEYGKKQLQNYLLSEKNLISLYEMSKKAQLPEAKAKRKITMEKNKHQQGSKNSQYGKMWITDGINNKKIKKEEIISEGWKKGRVQKNNFI